MAYSQFNTLKLVKKNLGIQITNKLLFAGVEKMPPSEFLLSFLEMTTGHKTAFFSEKSRSEAIVFPVLVNLQKEMDFQFSLYSGATIDAEKERGLNGECDYILGKGEQGAEIETPIFCVVEAKDNDIDIGIPQCIAQLCGADLFNKQEGIKISPLYGCTTTGETWQFIKYEDGMAVIDTKRYYLTQLDEILGIIRHIVLSN